MTETETNEFWDLIARCASDDEDQFCKKLRAEAARLDDEKLLHAYCQWQIASSRAYDWNLWAAAYIRCGGCSDDSFADFRNWLISRGRDVFEAALADAESLVPELEAFEDPRWEEAGYVLDTLYEERGHEIPDHETLEIPPEDTPSGEPWPEETETLRKRWPKLWAKFGW